MLNILMLVLLKKLMNFLKAIVFRSDVQTPHGSGFILVPCKCFGIFRDELVTMMFESMPYCSDDQAQC